MSEQSQTPIRDRLVDRSCTLTVSFDREDNYEPVIGSDMAYWCSRPLRDAGIQDAEDLARRIIRLARIWDFHSAKDSPLDFGGPRVEDSTPMPSGSDE